MIITISDEKATAAIDSLGAQLISLKDQNQKEYVWQRDPEFWPKSSPLLFPIVGNLRNNKTVIEGREYEIQKHGFCRETDFTVTKQAADSVTFQITDNAATKAVYPYAFRLSLTYTLENGCLNMEYMVENADSRPIHYCIGAHPGFNCPMEEGTAFEEYVLKFSEKETAGRLVYDLENLQFESRNRVMVLDHSDTLPLDYSLFDQDAFYFDDLKSRRVSLVHSVTGKGIEVTFPGFETVAFWSPMKVKAPFLCIEPWNGSGIYSEEDDNFLHKNHLQTLAVGESKKYEMGIRILN